MYYLTIVAVLFALTRAQDAPDPEKIKHLMEEHFRNLNEFHKVFEVQLWDSHEAVREITHKTGRERKRRLFIKNAVQMNADEIAEHRALIKRSGWRPGMMFVSDPFIKNSLTFILHDTAFFVELTLWHPDDVKDAWKSNRTARAVLKWAIEFCNKTGFYPESFQKYMHAIGQELEITEKDPFYVNPYKYKRMEGSEFFSEDWHFMDVRAPDPHVIHQEAHDKWNIPFDKTKYGKAMRFEL